MSHNYDLLKYKNIDSENELVDFKHNILSQKWFLS